MPHCCLHISHDASRLVRRRSFHLRFDIVRNMLFFGVPTIFSDMASWVLQLSDRYLLSHFGSLAETASYTVAYTLGGVLSPLILAPFGLAWIPVMYVVAKRKDAAHIFQLVFRWYSVVLLFATFALSLLGTFVLDLLFPPPTTLERLLFLSLPYRLCLTGINYIFIDWVYICRKTYLHCSFTTIAACVNVLLNIFFIPLLGL